MISIILLKIALSTFIAFIFFVIIAEALYGKDWYKQEATKAKPARVLGGAQILFFMLNLFAGAILLVWGV